MVDDDPFKFHLYIDYFYIFVYLYDTLNCSILLNKFVDTLLLSEVIYLIFANYTHEPLFTIICSIFSLLDVNETPGSFLKFCIFITRSWKRMCASGNNVTS